MSVHVSRSSSQIGRMFSRKHKYYGPRHLKQTTLPAPDNHFLTSLSGNLNVFSLFLKVAMTQTHMAGFIDLTNKGSSLTSWMSEYHRKLVLLCCPVSHRLSHDKMPKSLLAVGFKIYLLDVHCCDKSSYFHSPIKKKCLPLISFNSRHIFIK